MKKKFLNLNKFAIMQGRLVDSEKKKYIQYFPEKKWIQELETFKLNKFNFIEWVANFENLKKNPIFTTKGIKKIKNECKKNQVSIRAVDAQFFIKNPFFRGAENQKKERFKILKKILNHSQALKIKFFIIPALENSKIKNKTEQKFFVEGIRKLVKLLKNKSYILIESDLRPNKFKEVLKKIGSKKVGINYDIGNSAGNGYDFTDEIKYFDKVKNIHIKDKNFKGKSVRLGEGDANFQKIFKYLKKTKYKGFFSFQCARSKSDDHLGEMKKNIEFIRKFI